MRYLAAAIMLVAAIAAIASISPVFAMVYAAAICGGAILLAGDRLLGIVIRLVEKNRSPDDVANRRAKVSGSDF